MVRSPNDRLRDAREAMPSPRVPGACASRAELAELVNAWLHRNVGHSGAMDANYLARLERGAVRRPGRDYRAAFRAALGAADDAALGFVRPDPSHGPLKASQSDDLDPVGVMTPDDDERVSTVARCPRRVDAPALEAIANTLAAVRRLEDETSAADVAPSVAAQQHLADRLAADAPQRLHARAVGLSSELAQYRGWLSIPGQHWHDARQHLDRAITLALEADDPQRLATALSFQAYRAMRCDELRTADALSQAAGRDGRIDTGLATYLRFQRAEILARSSEHADAAKLLADADTMIEHLPPADELPDSGYWYVPSFFLGQRAFVLDALGDRHAAHESAAACLSEMPAEWAASEWARRRRSLVEA